MELENSQAEACQDIPLPIVKLNRWVIVVGAAAALLLAQPLLTTLLFLLILPAALFGQRFSPIFKAGRLLFGPRLAVAHLEDRRVQRFNNGIAAAMLGGAQIAFLLDLPAVGWGLTAGVGAAAAVALAGFCFGCFLYFQFKLQQYRLLGN